MTQVLTLKRVKAKALEAYKARTLTAQARNPNDRVCEYERGNCKCAIGASMFKTTLALIAEKNLNSIDVEGVSEHEVIGFPSKDEMNQVEAIQDAHDLWAKASNNLGAKADTTIKNRTAFLKLIAA